MATTAEIQQALQTDRTVDITTTGRRSGQARRIEIWFHQLGERTYISGLPGRRGWYANLLANPEFVFHLKHSVRADLPARARPITEPAERKQVLETLLPALNRESQLESWLRASPIIEVLFS